MIARGILSHANRQRTDRIDYTITKHQSTSRFSTEWKSVYQNPKKITKITISTTKESEILDLYEKYKQKEEVCMDKLKDKQITHLCTGRGKFKPR